MRGLMLIAGLVLSFSQQAFGVGLEWRTLITVHESQAAAAEFCATASFPGGGTGYRLPTMDESEASFPSFFSEAVWWTDACDDGLCQSAKIVDGAFGGFEALDPATELPVFCVKSI